MSVFDDAKKAFAAGKEFLANDSGKTAASAFAEAKKAYEAGRTFVASERGKAMLETGAKVAALGLAALAARRAAPGAAAGTVQAEAERFNRTAAQMAERQRQVNAMRRMMQEQMAASNDLADRAIDNIAPHHRRRDDY